MCLFLVKNSVSLRHETDSEDMRRAGRHRYSTGGGTVEVHNL